MLTPSDPKAEEKRSNWIIIAFNNSFNKYKINNITPKTIETLLMKTNKEFKIEIKECQLDKVKGFGTSFIKY